VTGPKAVPAPSGPALAGRRRQDRPGNRQGRGYDLRAAGGKRGIGGFTCRQSRRRISGAGGDVLSEKTLRKAHSLWGVSANQVSPLSPV
jgi:hypothetical protein